MNRMSIGTSQGSGGFVAPEVAGVAYAGVRCSIGRVPSHRCS